MGDQFNAAAAERLFREMSRQAAAIGGDAWVKNRDAIGGYLRDLAEDAVKTQMIIAQGGVDAETASELLAMHRRARHSLKIYAELSVLQSAQAILDMATGMVASSIRAHTGVNVLALAAR